jgi:16S rRNA processing protein RimM
MSVLSAGNDLLEVKVEGQKLPVLIPFVNEIVPIVDLKNKRIEITPPPGLLELSTTSSTEEPDDADG